MSDSDARILIVDDEPANRKLLRDVLVRGGAGVTTASGGAEALTLLAERSFDVVLLDLMMPEVDGLAVLAELRQQGRLSALPVVIVTANHESESRVQALEAGAIDFLTKPVDRFELTCKVRALAELKRLRDRERTRAAEAATAELLSRIEETAKDLPLLLYEIELGGTTDFKGSWLIGDVERLVGVTAREFRDGLDWQSLVHPEDREDALRVMREFLAGEATTSATRLRLKTHADGYRWFTHMARFDARRRVQSGILLDVNRQKEIEDQLFQSQKMQAVGQLAGGIAHDFNNVLAVILSFAGFVAEALPAGDLRRSDIDEVMQAANRAASLTRQLLSFSRKQPTESQPTDLNQRLAELDNLLRRTLGKGLDLRIALAPEPAVVEIDPVKFDQIVLNLVVNARDAMPEGGTLDIAITREPKHDAKGRSVRLRVTDSGIGMDEPTLRRIFEPFFTTKEKGKGTGLGLATCFAIVEAAGGRIHVESAVGRGTTFTVELPACDRLVHAAEAAASTQGARGGETVLLVEDEPQLLRATARVFEAEGYRVRTAQSGSDALKVIDELGSALDVVVTDIVLPAVGGVEVATYAARVAPSAVVLLTSGYVDKVPHEMRESFRVLWKPMPPRDIARAVAGELARKRRVTAPAGDAPRETAALRGGWTFAALPQSAARAAEGVEAASADEHAAERVLLVDGDPAVLDANTRVLRAAGFGVETATTLTRARARLAARVFDALVLELVLPDGAGLELLADLRGAHADLPVVTVTASPSVESAQRALERRVSEYLVKPFPSEALTSTVRASIDMARSRRVGAQLRAARHGGDEFLADRAGTERAFDSALTQIQMAFQPIVRGADGSLFGYEALLRCAHTTFASPPRLLAAAQVLGRHHELGRAIRSRIAAALDQHPDCREVIFVNLDVAELNDERLIEASDPLLPFARRTVLEVAERDAVGPAARFEKRLDRIRELGYRLAVDDLGEGSGGLTSVALIRPDIVKVDMSLVRDIQRAPLKLDILTSVIRTARRSGALVAAEGVESTAERDALVERGCDLLQGYLFGKPGSAFAAPPGEHGGHTPHALPTPESS